MWKAITDMPTTIIIAAKTHIGRRNSSSRSGILPANLSLDFSSHSDRAFAYSACILSVALNEDLIIHRPKQTIATPTVNQATLTIRLYMSSWRRTSGICSDRKLTPVSIALPVFSMRVSRSLDAGSAILSTTFVATALASLALFHVAADIYSPYYFEDIDL
ncbi:hypothetical protein RsoM2USA_391 [Ralstonia phage RsoM2USA]|nr:hypothetical protein RsoM2USA_391 [Ralstonia phage RsoM2USA]